MLKPKNAGTVPGTIKVTLEGLLLSQRLITPDQIAAARQFMARENVNFGTAIQFLQMISSDRIRQCLEARAGVPGVDPNKIAISAGIKNLLTPDQARALQVFPLNFVEESGNRILLLGMTDPLDLSGTSRVEGICRMAVQPAFLSLDALQSLYRRYYRTALALYSPDVESAGERTVERRIRTAQRESVPVTSSAKLTALISLLIKKGVFTDDELRRELELCSSK